MRLTAATAYQMKVNGELLDVGQRLALAEKLSVEDRKDQIAILREQADRSRTAASELGALADQYKEIGAFDALNDKWNDLNGVLQRASVYAGREVTSLEDLKAAQTEVAGQADRAKRTIDGLTASIDESRIAANEEAAAKKAEKQKNDEATVVAVAAKDKEIEDLKKQVATIEKSDHAFTTRTQFGFRQASLRNFFEQRLDVELVRDRLAQHRGFVTFALPRQRFGARSIEGDHDAAAQRGHQPHREGEQIALALHPRRRHRLIAPAVVELGAAQAFAVGLGL